MHHSSILLSCGKNIHTIHKIGHKLPHIARASERVKKLNFSNPNLPQTGRNRVQILADTLRRPKLFLFFLDFVVLVPVSDVLAIFVLIGDASFRCTFFRPIFTGSPFFFTFFFNSLTAIRVPAGTKNSRPVGFLR